MVQAVIEFGERQDRIINIVKGKFGLKNKTEAVNMIIKQYEEEFLEPELRPEYVRKLKRISKGKHHKFKNIVDLKKQIEG